MVLPPSGAWAETDDAYITAPINKTNNLFIGLIPEKRLIIITIKDKLMNYSVYNEVLTLLFLK
jgi:hypothetical protein